MKIWITLFTLGLLLPLSAQDSLNMKKLGQWDDNSLPLRDGGAYSDIWGYSDGQGNEYAIIGSIDKVHFINVTNPANPVVVDEFTTGSSSIWRDFKTYGQYAYAVADEGSEGLYVFDLSNLPNSVSIASQNSTTFLRAHNIFIDTPTGKLYAAGSTTNITGLTVFDLIANPANPPFDAAPILAGGYVHDLFARNDTVYCHHGGNGLYVYDFSTTNNPTLLGTLTSYPEPGYNHSSWLTDDGDHLVFCDETKGRGVKIADVSDLTDITVSPNNVFRSTLEAPGATNSIAHNPFILGDSVYIAYYHDGVQVFDISNPDNVTRAGYYDTYPDNTNYSGWYGAWGVYPYLPSGNIIASDILNGLIVLNWDVVSLPVELQSFTLEAENKNVRLNWITASEIDNDYFDIQRSADGSHFQSIGRVEGNGTTAEKQDYDFVDETPQIGANYYRLRQVDYDGTEHLSPIRLIKLESKEGRWTVFPRLLQAGQSLTIESSNTAPGAIQILEMSGRLRWQGTVSGRQQLDQVNDWPAGVYVARLPDRQVVRFVITR